MTAACQRRFSKLVERAFLRGLPARQRRELRQHLTACASCRTSWDRLAAVERQMGGPRLDDDVLDDIASAVITTPRSRRVWWASGAIGVIATTAIIIAIVIVRSDRSEQEFSSRGDPSTGRTPGVRLFCVSSEAEHVVAEARMVSGGHVPELRCTIDDDLQLAYTSPDREGLTMVAFARLDSMTIHYAPITNAESTTTVRADRIDELVDWSTPLAAQHAPGIYDVVVRFFDREVPARDAIDGRIQPLIELRAKLDITNRGGNRDAR
jgi:hypothetical protein